MTSKQLFDREKLKQKIKNPETIVDLNYISHIANQPAPENIAIAASTQSPPGERWYSVPALNKTFLLKIMRADVNYMHCFGEVELPYTRKEHKIVLPMDAEWPVFFDVDLCGWCFFITVPISNKEESEEPYYGEVEIQVAMLNGPDDPPPISDTTEHENDNLVFEKIKLAA